MEPEPIDVRFDTEGEPWRVSKRAFENIVRQRRQAAANAAAAEAEQQRREA